jgi:hypothetical protein
MTIVEFEKPDLKLRKKAQQDQYWNDLEYRTVVTCSKEEEDRALESELYYLKMLWEKFKPRLTN